MWRGDERRGGREEGGLERGGRWGGGMRGGNQAAYFGQRLASTARDASEMARHCRTQRCRSWWQERANLSRVRWGSAVRIRSVDPLSGSAVRIRCEDPL